MPNKNKLQKGQAIDKIIEILDLLEPGDAVDLIDDLPEELKDYRDERYTEDEPESDEDDV